VSCARVRELLPERALGTLGAGESTSLDRHLQWCAACRKEADELGSAAAILGFAVPASRPSPELEERVVATVQRRAGRGLHAHAAGRRGRLAIAAVTAAMIAVLGLGWGAVMAGKAARSDAIAHNAIQSRETVAERFQKLLANLPFDDPQNEVLLGTLAPSSGAGGGSALTLVSPSIMNMSVVMLSELRAPAPHTLPYTVRLAGPRLPTLIVGRIRQLDSGGNAIINRDFTNSLAGYDRVVVRDARGRVVLRGTLGTPAAIASPTP
jgi:Putative zinc-finger